MELTEGEVRLIARNRTAKQNRKKFIVHTVAGFAIAIIIILPNKLPLYIQFPGYIFLAGVWAWYAYQFVFRLSKPLEAKLLKEWKQHTVS